MPKKQALEIFKRLTPLGGVLVFLLVFFSETDLSSKQQSFLAIFSFVVYNWLFAVLPLYVTGFLGVALTVLFGVEQSSVILSSFANPIIFLFLSGFLFAHSMNEIGLDRRLSLKILGQKLISSSFERLLLALYGLCAFFSMWVSNTATTAMMLPIALGMANSLGIKDKKTISFILIGLAYSASIGGLATPVGSPPNIIAIGMLKEIAGIELSFALWTLIGVPFSVFFLLILFWFVKKNVNFQGVDFNSEFIRHEQEKIGEVTPAEKNLMALFAALVFFWFMPGIFSSFLGSAFPAFLELEKRLDPGIVGIFFSSLLFIFPLKTSQKLLRPEHINKVDWASLLLFGSGLALGKALFDTGLAQIAGEILVSSVSDSNFFLYLLAIGFFTKFFTEVSSNTASANIILPIIIASSVSLGQSPLLPAILIAFSCSLAFMLPVATPPNTIVYGSGRVNALDMAKLGLILNLVFGVLLAALFSLFNYLI